MDQQIKEMVAEKTGQSEEQVDLSIAGKAVEEAQQDVAESQGLTLPGLQKLVEKKTTNVSSKSFGIKVIDPNRGKEVVANMVYVDDKVPVTVSQKFGTHDENQAEADLVCMENQEPNGNRVVEMEVCREVGKAVLKFNKPMPRNSPVEITFSLGPDGLLSLNGKDLTDQVEIDAVLETESIMSREEVEASKSRNLAMAVS